MLKQLFQGGESQASGCPAILHSEFLLSTCLSQRFATRGKYISHAMGEFQEGRWYSSKAIREVLSSTFRKINPYRESHRDANQFMSSHPLKILLRLCNNRRSRPKPVREMPRVKHERVQVINLNRFIISVNLKWILKQLLKDVGTNTAMISKNLPKDDDTRSVSVGSHP